MSEKFECRANIGFVEALHAMIEEFGTKKVLKSISVYALLKTSLMDPLDEKSKELPEPGPMLMYVLTHWDNLLPEAKKFYEEEYVKADLKNRRG